MLSSKKSPIIPFTELARYIDWRKFDKGKNEFVPARPEDRVRERDAFTGGEVEFQKGVRGDYGPTLRPDGTLLLEEGYDPATGLILMSPPVMPIIPGKPTREEGLAALTLLDGLLEEVAFVDEPSRSVALSD